jgi:hypothetical protein
MILFQNLPRVCDVAREAERVLDVGGWCHGLNLATHVLDIAHFTKTRQEPIDPENQPRWTPETWIVHDACKAPWPFPDKHFDFSFCSHLLEDVRDPLTVCAELVRVSKAGYIETPSRQREIFSKARLFWLKTALGRMPEVGFYHHRWFVEIEGTHVRFLAKDQRLLLSRRNFITRHDLGRKMTEAESAIGLFWTDSFTFEETFFDGTTDLRGYRDRVLHALRSR